MPTLHQLIPAFTLLALSLVACSKSSQGEAENGNASIECDDPLTKDEMSLDPAAVHAVIEENRQALQICYERVLSMNPALEGQIDVNLVIEANGEPSMVCSSASSLESTKVISCVLSTIARFRFPQQSEQVATVYPLSFSPG